MTRLVVMGTLCSHSVMRSVHSLAMRFLHTIPPYSPLNQKRYVCRVDLAGGERSEMDHGAIAAADFVIAAV